MRATDRGREVFAIARELTAEVDAWLRRQMGDAKIEQPPHVLQELDAALRPA